MRRTMAEPQHLQPKRNAQTHKLREKRRLAKRRDQPRNNNGQFTSPNKNAVTDLNLSIISDDEFDCCSKSEGKPVQTNIEDELQLLPKDNNLTPEQGRYKKKNKKNQQNWLEDQIDYLLQNKPKN